MTQMFANIRENKHSERNAEHGEYNAEQATTARHWGQFTVTYLHELIITQYSPTVVITVNANAIAFR